MSVCVGVCFCHMGPLVTCSVSCVESVCESAVLLSSPSSAALSAMEASAALLLFVTTSSDALVPSSFLLLLVRHLLLVAMYLFLVACTCLYLVGSQSGTRCCW